MSMGDAAIEFTQRYLTLLEQHLSVTWSDDGTPYCIIDWIRDESLVDLHAGLTQLFQSDLAGEARKAAADFGATHVQTVGFGLAPDFRQFIQLGLIYGERVVLWDVIHSRILAGDQPRQATKSLLAQVVCNLLLLKHVAARGGVAVLPHPIQWSPLAATIEAELRALGPVPAATLGLSMALAAIEEGIPLHPYTLLADAGKPKAPETLAAHADALFSAENFQFQRCVTTLLRDERLAYLEDVAVEKFFDIVSRQTAFRRAIRKHFSSALAGLSPQQATAETGSLIDELFALAGKQNTAIVDYAAEAADATAKFMLVSASVAVIGQPLLLLLAALGPPALYLTTALRKWAKKPEKNVIVQTFRTLEQSTSVSGFYDPVYAEFQLANFHSGQASLDGLHHTFMHFHWTEERHHFLETLPREIAKALLESLTADDLEVIVNWRQFQQDYIGDYLVYLSGLDEDIYWVHLGKTFESSEGLLIYDDDANVVSMETRDMPLATWQQLLDSLFVAYAKEMRARKYNYPLERFPGIVRFQTERAASAEAKRQLLAEFAAGLKIRDWKALRHLVAQAYDGSVPAWFAVE